MTQTYKVYIFVSLGEWYYSFALTICASSMCSVLAKRVVWGCMTILISICSYKATNLTSTPSQPFTTWAKAYGQRLLLLMKCDKLFSTISLVTQNLHNCWGDCNCYVIKMMSMMSICKNNVAPMTNHTLTP